ncbi:MAG: hypothetical protein ACK562_08580 [Acidobacteriota bacterium]|jgi:hypothetical protein
MVCGMVIGTIRQTIWKTIWTINDRYLTVSLTSHAFMPTPERDSAEGLSRADCSVIVYLSQTT